MRLFPVKPLHGTGRDTTGRVKSQHKHKGVLKLQKLSKQMNLQERYLDLLKSSLLNTIYLENDVRMLYVCGTLLLGKNIEAVALRNIGKYRPDLVVRIRKGRQEGRPWAVMMEKDKAGNDRKLNLRNVAEFAHTMVGRKRLDNITDCLDRIREDRIPGDLIETGVWRGGACILMRAYLEIWEMPGRIVWAADSFEGLPVPSLPEDAGWDLSIDKEPILAITLEEVQENFRRYGLLDDRVRFLKGWFKDTLPQAPVGPLALLRLDGDLYESTRDAIEALYDKVSPGGFIVVDDYGDFEPCRKAIDEFRQKRGITEPLVAVDWSCSYWRKS